MSSRSTDASPSPAEREIEFIPPVKPASAWVSKAALAGAVLWLLLLLVMTVFQANPVTVYYRQIARAELVVSATILDLETKTVEVEKEWKLGLQLPDEPLIVLDLPSSAQQGKHYLLALTSVPGRERNQYRITRTALKPEGQADETPILYPNTKDTRRQLETILKEL